MSTLHERHESLWRLALPPLLWLAHFLASYFTGALWCGRFGDGSLATPRLAIAGYTVAALVGITLVGGRALRRHLLGGQPPPHDEDSAADRTRFLGQATLLLSGLSAVAVLFGALVAVFIPECD